MRIGFEAKRATHNFRGLGNYSRGLIEGLLQYNPGEELLLYGPPVKDKRGLKWVNSLPANATLKYPQSFLETHFASFWRSFLLASDLKRDQLDVFHGLSHEIPFGLSGAMPFKKIVTIHDLIFIRYPEFFPFIDRIVYMKKIEYACKHSDMVIAICEQTKEDLIKLLKVDEKKIVVHYQSCAPIFYQTEEPNKIKLIREKYNICKPYILHVGAFEENKNQLTLLLAYAQIAEKTEEDLVFVGRGKGYKEKVELKVRELNLKNRVHFLSTVSFDELPAIYQAASAFCFPSLFEGFGLPIIEAMFSKIPVITTNGSCFPESAGADSLFIDPLSQSSIANGLLRVLGDQELRNLMRNRGLEFVKRFHLKASTNKLADLYGQVLK